jgi:hypothetical protein
MECLSSSEVRKDIKIGVKSRFIIKAAAKGLSNPLEINDMNLLRDITFTYLTLISFLSQFFKA